MERTLIEKEQKYPQSTPDKNYPANHEFVVSQTPAQKIHRLQQTYGNQAICRMLRSSSIVSPPPGMLKVSQPHDPAEQEAERVANTISLSQHTAVSSPLSSQQQYIAQQEMEPLSGGQPLSPQIKQTMESHLDHNFDSVRVHNDAQAHQLNETLDARACTLGNHIWLGKGEHETDEKLMAHELVHVEQKKSDRIFRYPLATPTGTGYELSATTAPEKSTAPSINTVAKDAAIQTTTTNKFEDKTIKSLIPVKNSFTFTLLLGDLKGFLKGFKITFEGEVTYYAGEEPLVKIEIGIEKGFKSLLESELHSINVNDLLKKLWCEKDVEQKGFHWTWLKPEMAELYLKDNKLKFDLLKINANMTWTKEWKGIKFSVVLNVEFKKEWDLADVAALALKLSKKLWPQLSKTAGFKMAGRAAAKIVPVVGLVLLAYDLYELVAFLNNSRKDILECIFNESEKDTGNSLQKIGERFFNLWDKIYELGQEDDDLYKLTAFYKECNGKILDYNRNINNINNIDNINKLKKKDMLQYEEHAFFNEIKRLEGLHKMKYSDLIFQNSQIKENKNEIDIPKMEEKIRNLRSQMEEQIQNLSQEANLLLDSVPK